MSVLALIPARAGSTGCVGKNTRRLGDATLIEHAAFCAFAVTDRVVLTTDIEGFAIAGATLIERPAELATGTASMLSVVQHALAQIPGDESDIICLLQPTAVFRTPAHIRRAIALLQETGADSVVSVVPLPLTHHPDWALRLHGGQLWQWCEDDSLRVVGDPAIGSRPRPTRRQDLTPLYKRDGTVYCLRRSTVAKGTLYGNHTQPLFLDPSETCELDTELDWQRVEARWKEREHARP